MIHRLRLRNWRSYEALDLELGPGTTFVVAPNGVGKTSLVYGLAWGVLDRIVASSQRTAYEPALQVRKSKSSSIFRWTPTRHQPDCKAARCSNGYL